jgi:ATP-dependent helicase/nuclease subunit A
VDDTELDNFAGSSRVDEAQTEIENQKSRIKDSTEPPRAGCYEDFEKLRLRLEWNYPFQAATQQKAKSSVTALRREAEDLDDEAEELLAGPAPRRTARNLKSQFSKLKLSAAEIGAAHHKFLQHVALDKTGDLAAEADRLARGNYLSADERAVLDLAMLAAFWNSPLGKKIVAHAASVRRELPFTARFSPAEIAAITGAKIENRLEDEFVVVQGVADLAVLRPEEIWLVDFKTDEVGKSELPEKTKIYKPQLQLYAAALEKIFARNVTLRALHFLSVRRTVEL